MDAETNKVCKTAKLGNKLSTYGSVTIQATNPLISNKGFIRNAVTQHFEYDSDFKKLNTERDTMLIMNKDIMDRHQTFMSSIKSMPDMITILSDVKSNNGKVAEPVKITDLFYKNDGLSYSQDTATEEQANTNYYYDVYHRRNYKDLLTKALEMSLKAKKPLTNSSRVLKLMEIWRDKLARDESKYVRSILFSSHEDTPN